MADNETVSEALVAKPLPEMIQNLGLAVAKANAEMAKNPAGHDTVYVVHSARVELNIAVSMSKGSEAGVEAGFGFNAFSVNASYARTYNFKEEASSKIVLDISAKPPAE
ncbi:MAG: hypothetical protein MI741_19000 [Rhodospirillales bacterium]|nr:hypothetical protein [Rhodospirillales bacterium]